MGQAEELLNSLNSGETEAVAGDCVIIGSDRAVIVPENLKMLGVSPDNGVNTIKFIGPRYSENGSDLSKLNIWVNFMRSDDYGDKAPCTNVTVDPDDDTLLHYEWEITRNVTEVHGNVAVLVCAKEVDAAGNEKDHWNSLPYRDFYVAEGMEVDGEGLINQYPDLVEYMLLRIVTVENKTTKAAIFNYIDQYLDEDPSVIVEHIEAIIAEQPIQEYVNEYLGEYVDICTTEARTLDNSHAGAYEMVSMAGVSEQPRYEGYQLFDASKLKSFTAGGTTVTNNDDGSYTVTGSGNLTDLCGTAKIYTHEETVAMLKKAGTLRLSCDTTSVPYIYVALWQDGNAIGEATNRYNTTASTEITESMLVNETFTMRIGFYGFAGDAITPTTVKPMLYMDGGGTWEPFTGVKPSPNPEYPQEIKSVGPEVTVKTCNKNIVEPDIPQTTTYGVTLTKNDDGSVTLNGTATANAFFRVGRYKAEPGYYYLSGCTGGSASTYLLYTQDKNGNKYASTINGEKRIEIDSADIRYVLVAVYKGVTVNNLTFYPMVSKDGGEYVKHQESTATITLPDEPRGIDDIYDVIEKKDSKWGVSRKWGKAVLDAANFAEVTWTEYENVTIFTLPKPEDSLVYGQYLTASGLCDKFRYDVVSPFDSILSVGNINTSASAPNIWFGFPKGTTLEEAQAVGEIEFVYQLAEPTWEELDEAAQFALDNLEVYDGITHVFVEGTDVQPVVTSKYGTSECGAKVITQANEIEKLKEQIGDINTVLENLIGGE